MSIIQCKMCNKPFQSISGRTCPDCVKKIDQDFITVRDFIYENPGSRINKVCEETGVQKAIVLQLLREGRLTLDGPDSEGLLTCEVCKAPIESGRMCKACKNKVATTMNQNISGGKPPQQESKTSQASKHTAKMHTDISRKK